MTIGINKKNVTYPIFGYGKVIKIVWTFTRLRERTVNTPKRGKTKETF